MITWHYTHGHIVAQNRAGAVLLALSTDPALAPFADLLNANQTIGELILAGYGYHPDTVLE